MENSTDENKNTSVPIRLDARHLLCPLPVIRTQDAIKKLTPGALITVISTDPGVKIDIPSWCRMNGHAVLEILEEDHDILITIRIGDE
jgi:tRNA 2-thiouridine synthesizing protein A